MSVGGIILAIVIGLIAGFIARAVIPGKQAMGILATIVLGLIGSIVGNLLSGLLFEPHRIQFVIGGWWASIIGAIIVLGVYVAATGNRHRTAVRR